MQIDKTPKYEITVDDKSCKLRELDRQTLEVALGLIMNNNSKPQYIRAGEIILNACWVEGDEEIKTNDKYLVAAAFQAFQLIEIKDAQLKKI